MTKIPRTTVTDTWVRSAMFLSVMIIPANLGPHVCRILPADFSAYVHWGNMDCSASKVQS